MMHQNEAGLAEAPPPPPFPDAFIPSVWIQPTTGSAATTTVTYTGSAPPPPPPGIFAAFSGIGVSPALAAALRAVAYIVITAVLDAAILKFTQAPPAALALYSTIIIGALRLLEGVADGFFKGNASAARAT